MRVLGVDGCPGGWAVAELDLERDTIVQIRRESSVAPLIEGLRHDAASVVGIDMPIGLPRDRPRACDLAARRLLGRRGSSVFPTPMRAVLAAQDYDDACELSFAASGKKLSKQTWNLVPKIAEVDTALPDELTTRMVEAHPELAFLRLAGEVLAPKASPAGRSARVAALRSVVAARLLLDAPVPLGDALDACANAVTARHVHRGTGRCLGADSPVDATGKPMHIWW